jgi:hypothetical protein
VKLTTHLYLVQRLKIYGIIPPHTNHLLLALLSSFLGSTAQLGLGLLHKIRLNFLEASQQFSFLQDRVISPTHNPHHNVVLN